MKLPEGFRFSQSSLQDFVDCRRRFQYRYLQRLAWPALIAESTPGIDETALTFEQRLYLGERFHHLVRQHLSGVPLLQLEAMLQAERSMGVELLRRWWEAYRNSVAELLQLPNLESGNLPDGLFPELSVSAGVGKYRLLAKFDLVVIDANRARIIDWKTGHPPKTKRQLSDRLQTRVYRYLLQRVAAALWPERDLQPAQIEMIYWFSEDPTRSFHLPYSPAEYRADEIYLTSLIQEIQSLEENEFPLTNREERCRFCVYRSLCERGVRAGILDEEEMAWLEPPQVFESFDQVGEIAF